MLSAAVWFGMLGSRICLRKCYGAPRRVGMAASEHVPGFSQQLGRRRVMADRAGEGTASLEKAIDVLEAVGASPQGIGHLDLASRLSLPKTTVYRILSTLVARGLVWRDPF